MISDTCGLHRMYDNAENTGCKKGRMRKLPDIRRSLSRFGHRVCYIIGCSKHSHIPAPSFKRLWKKARNFIVHIPDEFMLATSTEINYVVFFTEEEKRFDVYVFFMIKCYMFIFVTPVF